jgi:hypothetical protein
MSALDCFNNLSIVNKPLLAQLLQKAHPLHSYSIVKSQCFESSPRLNSFITFISDIVRTVITTTTRTIENTMLNVCRVYSLSGKNNGN